ncbi:MAG: thiopeptide-type bacteriocin biosynthesis protein [Streptosporangiaceae bacterium]|jgi:thiopeptide-type bacteriocin biosynthesis protein
MDNTRPWHQVYATFPEWTRAEPTVLARLVPQLFTAEGEGLIDAWFFIRKRPCWRVRYLPAADASAKAQARIEQHLDELTASQNIDGWTQTVYEPEVHAFGGTRAMTAAHRLFHRDSRCLLAYLQGESGAAPRHRREISVMLCSILMRAAGQDWYEQGDVWARVASHREPPGGHRTVPGTFQAAVRRLMTVDAESQMSQGAPLAHAAQWAAAYAAAGRELAGLAADGLLHRGFRDILAHHVIFAWNRLGLPYADQALLAATAKTVVFGIDPATRQATEGRQWPAQKTG